MLSSWVVNFLYFSHASLNDCALDMLCSSNFWEKTQVTHHETRTKLMMKSVPVSLVNRSLQWRFVVDLVVRSFIYQIPCPFLLIPGQQRRIPKGISLGSCLIYVAIRKGIVGWHQESTSSMYSPREQDSDGAHLTTTAATFIKEDYIVTHSKLRLFLFCKNTRL